MGLPMSEGATYCPNGAAQIAGARHQRVSIHSAATARPDPGHACSETPLYWRECRGGAGARGERCRPGHESRLRGPELVNVDVIPVPYPLGRDAGDAGQAFREPVDSEATISGRSELQELTVRELARAAYSVDVQEVAWLAPAEQRSDLVPNRILKRKDWPNFKRDRCQHSVVAAQVDVHDVAVRASHAKTQKTRDVSHSFRREPGILERFFHTSGRGREVSVALLLTEQVHVLGRALENAVLAQCSGPAQREPMRSERAQEGCRNAPLPCDLLVHAQSWWSTRCRDSHSRSTCHGSVSVGHTRSSRCALISSTTSACVPSFKIAV